MRFTMGHRDSFMLADDISNLLGSQASLDGGAPPFWRLHRSQPSAKAISLSAPDAGGSRGYSCGSPAVYPMQPGPCHRSIFTFLIPVC